MDIKPTVLDIAEFPPDEFISGYQRLVLGCADYQEGPMKIMQYFASNYGPQIINKVIATNVVCGNQPDIAKNKLRIASYLSKLNNPLPSKAY